MRAPPEYRAQAAECMGRAESAKSANHRTMLLDLAQTWLWTADDAERINKKLSDDQQKACGYSDLPRLGGKNAR